MILVGTSLEDLVVKFESSEVEDALAELKSQPVLDDLVAKPIIDQEAIDAISPVIEQDLDPQTYSHNEGYDVTIEYDGETAYKGHYKSADAKLKETSASYIANVQDHQMLEHGQEINDRAKRAYKESQVDIKSKVDVAEIQTRTNVRLKHSSVTWFLMFEGDVKYH